MRPLALEEMASHTWVSKADLRHLVDLFNRTYAGKTDSHGTSIPLVTLPAHFEFGDRLVTQDMRLSRNFPLGSKGSRGFESRPLSAIAKTQCLCGFRDARH